MYMGLCRGSCWLTTCQLFLIVHQGTGHQDYTMASSLWNGKNDETYGCSSGGHGILGLLSHGPVTQWSVVWNKLIAEGELLNSTLLSCAIFQVRQPWHCAPQNFLNFKITACTILPISVNIFAVSEYCTILWCGAYCWYSTRVDGLICE